ncbi:hypothetical protein ABN122_02990, partial [Enterobacter cloacae]|nr:hypothetical protein AWS33_13050 [Enterobacter cloacae subsp. cloacae]KYQ75818.1 hypothetical protein AX755_20245 [Enterobacter sp. SENG-6]PPV38102.1 hypothetical protein C4L14_13550 [Enterobacter sp. RC4]HAS1681837.1 hypothetical protein [Enterobacter cloacae]
MFPLTPTLSLKGEGVLRAGIILWGSPNPMGEGIVHCAYQFVEPHQCAWIDEKARHVIYSRSFFNLARLTNNLADAGKRFFHAPVRIRLTTQ